MGVLQMGLSYSRPFLLWVYIARGGSVLVDIKNDICTMRYCTESATATRATDIALCDQMGKLDWKIRMAT